MVWDVMANSVYDIPQDQSHRASRKRSPVSGKGIIVIRTFRGSGRMYHDEGVFDLTPGTLFLFDFENVKRYHTVEADWCYWWFEIYCDIPLHIPRHKVLSIPVDKKDEKEFQIIFDAIRKESFQEQCLATATFIKLLYKWWSACHDMMSSSPHEKKVLRLIDEMHKRIYSRFSANDMARIAGLSSSGLRKSFKDVTGKSPKKFFESMKLSMSMELLRSRHYNVKEVAEKLRFCDPYHFSKMFRRHFGHAPSKI